MEMKTWRKKNSVVSLLFQEQRQKYNEWKADHPHHLIHIVPHSPAYSTLLTSSSTSFLYVFVIFHLSSFTVPPKHLIHFTLSSTFPTSSTWPTPQQNTHTLTNHCLSTFLPHSLHTITSSQTLSTSLSPSHLTHSPSPGVIISHQRTHFLALKPAL